MNNQPVLNLIGMVLHSAGILSVCVLVFWRFFIPPSIRHLSTGEMIYNIKRREKIEFAFLLFLFGLFLLFLIENPSFLYQSGIPMKYETSVYLSTLFLVLFGGIQFYKALKMDRLIPLDEEVKKQKGVLLIFQNIISFIFLPMLIFSFTDIVELSTEEELSVSDQSDSTINITLFEKPYDNSGKTIITIKKREIITNYETCNFYKFSLQDTAGIAYIGYVLKKSEVFGQNGISVRRAKNIKNTCKKNKKKPEPNDCMIC